MKMREDMSTFEMWVLLLGVMVQNHVTPMIAAEWLLEQVEHLDEDELEKLEMSSDEQGRLFDDLVGLTWDIADPAYVEMMRGRG